MSTRHDMLLQWASERGEGSWELFKETFDWLCPPTDRQPWETPGFSIRLLSALGHLEIDWSARRWSATPPTLTLLPEAGGHLLLTGERTRALTDALEGAIGDSPDLFALPPHEQPYAPSAQLIACESAREAQRLADDLGATFTYSASDQLASILPTIDDQVDRGRAPAPPSGYGVKRFDLDELRPYDTDRFDRPGLYEHAAPAGPEFRLVDDDGLSYRIDRAWGIYAALSRWGENKLRYFEQSVNGDLAVQVDAPLPPLQARAATLCTGLAPEKRNKVLLYRNVPMRIAEAIARSLDQSVGEPAAASQ